MSQKASSQMVQDSFFVQFFSSYNPKNRATVNGENRLNQTEKFHCFNVLFEPKNKPQE